ncbi:mechanosensitive ion channel family protein [Fluviicola taffensis]|uniref:MscS Mechanosensitive ion channel n=1 Tax=Fluviicola taffensis (strain DSM 16823 / NCIMB 13979 / RW262) TaxID=755732 RepID=F2I9F7_FLUTR|nr:mechanosensitive ion channel domain-containing protein [Fluviicola taffensis]AEA45138.1 MscS Mechanosensitive ion channel [Fluviicola taffensis DSM 16823]
MIWSLLIAVADTLKDTVENKTTVIDTIDHGFKKIMGFTADDAKQWLVKSGTNLLVAAIIFFVGFWLAKWVGRLVVKILTQGKVDLGLITFLSSLATIILKILVVVTAITQLGIEMTSFVAILGAAGLAIGMAFSGTLSNFAGGVMVLLFKPFKVGDTILTQGLQGTVKEIQIFYTYLHTSDNKVIVIPNGPIANGPLTNFTKANTRRVDWSIPISYGDDFVKAHQLILKYLSEDKHVKKDPAPFVALGELGASVMITVRAWAKTDDYWSVYYELNRRIYEEFEKEGLNLTSPQEHLVQMQESK